jgi:hypothetical protein
MNTTEERVRRKQRKEFFKQMQKERQKNLDVLNGEENELLTKYTDRARERRNAEKKNISTQEQLLNEYQRIVNDFNVNDLEFVFFEILFENLN